MTSEEAIMYWEDFLGEIDQMEVDDCWTNEDAETQREATKMAISAIRQQDHFREATKKVEPLTNADQIRSMSDDELAQFLNQWGTSTRAWQKNKGETMYWLQMLAEEDDHA